MSAEIIVICGCRNSGKTTWICALVERLTAAGLRVGTLKHTHHDCRPPKKDSTRHQSAGASRVLLVSPVGATRYDEWSDEPALEDLVRDNFEGFELVLVEGYRQSPWPKLIVGEDPRANRHNVIMELPPLTAPPQSSDLDAVVDAVADHLSSRQTIRLPQSRRSS